ncbi:MAG: DUF536 domain-containing protein [Streptococcaceae bacterium]|jgi:uncharacterized protein (DUF3084 family)|nr:DUF536 domain-containing protein [Streptococcaceae bacterium]
MNTKTVSELAELFGVSRQAMNNRVRALSDFQKETNEKGFTVVNTAGIRELEHMYGRVVTAEQEVVEKPKVPRETPNESRSRELSKETAKTTKTDGQDATIFAMLSNLMEGKDQEIDRLTHQLNTKDQQITMLGGQLDIKDRQIAEKDKQLDQQQQLTAAALADREEILIELKAAQKRPEKRGWFGRKKK